MIFGYDDGGGLGQLEEGFVAGVGQEGQLPLAGFADAGHAGDLDGSVADDRTVDRPRDRLQRDLHDGLPLNRFAPPLREAATAAVIPPNGPEPSCSASALRSRLLSSTDPERGP